MAGLYDDRGQGRGLPADLQGLVTLTGIINRDHASGMQKKLKSHEAGNVVFPGSGTENEHDIRETEFLVTPARSVVASHENVSQIPVLSSFAGKTVSNKGNKSAEEAKREIMETERFVGVALQAVEMGGYYRHMDVPRSKVPVQISGVFSPRVGQRDMPFGARVRLDLVTGGRTRDFGTPEGIHHGKARLEMYPETDGEPFAIQTQRALHAYFNGNQRGDDASADAQAFGNFADLLVDFIAIVRASEDANAVVLRDPDARVDEYRDRTKRALKSMFALGLDGNVTRVNKEDRFGGDQSGGYKDSKVYDRHLTIGRDLLASLMDVVRYHNQWTIGTVIRAGRRGERCDVLM